MPSPGPGGFLGLGHSLRALTLSPMNSVLQHLHRQVRPHLETGGTATPVSKNVKKPPVPVDEFVLPKDIEADELMAAIDAKLRDQHAQPDGTTEPPPVLQRRAGGRVVMPAAHLLRLGDGDFARGRRFLHGLVWQIRRQRMQRYR